MRNAFLKNVSGMYSLLASVIKDPSEMFHEKDVLKNLSKFLEKHLYQRLYFKYIINPYNSLLKNNQNKLECKISYIIKGTVMQIKKALINDCQHVLKES